MTLAQVAAILYDDEATAPPPAEPEYGTPQDFLRDYVALQPGRRG